MPRHRPHAPCKQQALASDVLAYFRRYLHTNGLTLDELSHRLGRSRNYASRILDGSRGLTVENVERIAQALGLRVRIAFD